MRYGAAMTRVVAAVLVREGQVLAARRPPHKREGGLWELPGGKVEPGEDDATALVRELREELRIEVAAGAALAVSEHPYSHGVIQLVAVACRLVSGEPFPVEHSELRWLSVEELDTVVWAPADVPLLAAVRDALTPRRSDPS